MKTKKSSSLLSLPSKTISNLSIFSNSLSKPQKPYSQKSRLIKPWLAAAISISALSAISAPAQAACKVPKSYYKHVSCTPSSSYFLAEKDSGAPVALINKQGKRVVDLLAYSKVDVSKLKNGVMPVQRGGKVGYINTSGIEVIPTVYDVITGDKNTKGWARALNNNRIIVKKNGLFGIIDAKNNIILPFSNKYKTITDYKSKVSQVSKPTETIWVDLDARRIADPNAPKPKKSSSVTTQTSPKNQVSTTFPAPVEVWQPENRDGKWGFVNKDSVPMIKFAFDQVTPFSEGLAGVQLDGKWGFLNLAGKLVIPFHFREADIQRGDGDTYNGAQPFEFRNGKAWTGSLKDGTKLCIDKKGENVTCD